MRRSGTVARWDDVKGFGFIRGDGGSQDVFLHARAFRGGTIREGMRVTFDVIHVGGKGPRAVDAQPEGVQVPAAPSRSPVRSSPRPPTNARSPRRSRSASEAPSSGAWLFLLLTAGYGAALGYAVWMRHLPWWVIPAAAGLSLFTFFVYWQDKYAASKGMWRTPEQSLHVWSLAGGWPGAWVAQQVLRHKSKKQSFRSVYWGTAVLHCGAVGGWLWFVAKGA